MLETLSHTISQEVSEVFDLYTELHGARISFFVPSRKLLYPDATGRPNCAYCRMLRETLDMDSQCRALDQTMMQAALEKNEMISYTCHAGMREAVVPLFTDGLLAGYVMIGQFRSEEAPEESPYAARWREEQGSDVLQEAFAESPVFPEEKIETLLAMFRRLVELIIRSQLIHQKDYDLIAPAIEKMRQQPEAPLSLEEAARMSGRSPSTVTRLFKRITGKSFKQYQVGLRLQRAADQLIGSPSRSVSDIAASVGFDDPFYFSRLFHKHMGQPPSEYRNRTSKK
ncbi:MAG: PocR ligand-binding domain-containing protein [Kiritimatiellaceae bacterium]|nr:PocR ligand-binding domain-containing protein [Kiritimatiellaceae bacterium]